MKKSQKPGSRTASFVSLGCFKNTVDSEVLAGMLAERGVEIVSEYENPEWLVINTCGFVQDAKEESIGEILAALERKEKGEIKKVAVFGCLIQRYLSELADAFKHVDILWGVNDMEELAAAVASGRGAQYRDKKLFLYNHKHRRLRFTTANTTFLKISEGCNMACSFCSIPSIRGPYRSRSIESIIREAQSLKEAGVEELNLISQNSTYFGKDRCARSQLPDLLREVTQIGFHWLRVLYLMPEEMNEDILAAFAKPSVLPYFDLPFQHVSANVLRKMRRGGDYETNMRLVRQVRALFPQAVLRSTFIVGFPGEGEKDFSELLEFAKEAAIERIGVFGFSLEENTPSCKLAQRVRADVIEERKNRLLDVSDGNLKRYNRTLIGRNMDFLPLAPSPWAEGSTIGRIGAQAPEVDGHCQVKVKFNEAFTIFPIRISGVQDETLFGEKL